MRSHPHPALCLCPPCRARRRAELRAAIAESGRPATSYELALLAASHLEVR